MRTSMTRALRTGVLIATSRLRFARALRTLCPGGSLPENAAGATLVRVLFDGLLALLTDRKTCGSSFSWVSVLAFRTQQILHPHQSSRHIY
jgi:hypothetical protein